MPANVENFSSDHRTGKGQFSFQFQRKAMPKNIPTPVQMHSFHTKMGTIKDRNGMDLTETEDIKKRWQEYRRTIQKRSS